MFDALDTLGRIVENATRRVIFVNPYMSVDVLSKFSIMDPQGVSIDLPGGLDNSKKTLLSAAGAWRALYEHMRPLEVRFTDEALRHDRLIFIDDNEIWHVSQSLSKPAAHLPATIIKSTPEQDTAEIDAYDKLFDNAWKIFDQCKGESSSA